MKISIRKPLCFSEIGKKDNQEDFLWPSPDAVGTENRIFLMCDGVGGQDSGEVASQTAATALGTYLTAHPSADGMVTKAMFEEALANAYDELDKVDTGSARKMGTTMTCVVLHRGGALVAHIGDSRIYHVRPSLAIDGRTGIIYQSTDHSLVNDLLRVGEITEEEAKDFPQKNVITRAMQPNLERRYKADIYNLDDVQDGDYFFLCCDGVLEQLTNDKLGDILSDKKLDDQGKLDAIFSICDGKTRDNYTCWLIPIDKVEREASDATSVGEDEIAVVVANEDEEVQCVVEHNEKSVFWKNMFFGLIAILIAAGGLWYAMSDKETERTEKALSTDVMDTEDKGDDENATEAVDEEKPDKKETVVEKVEEQKEGKTEKEKEKENTKQKDEVKEKKDSMQTPSLLQKMTKKKESSTLSEKEDEANDGE